MTVYRGRPVTEMATSGHLPAVRLRRRVLRLLLTVVVLALLCNVLLVEAYTRAGFGSDVVRQDAGAVASVPADVHEGGPVLQASAGGMHSLRMPARTIALTFDDGPDPQWTPEVLQVLHRHHVHATFFVVGSQVAKFPGLTHRLVAEGHEIGAHTFTHPQLAELPAWRRSLELSQTQLAIAYATGVSTSLLRPPYSSLPGALDDQGWSAVQDVGRRGYLAVLSDIDSRDWERPGVEAIVRSTTLKGDDGAIVLMHDAGGDRAQTVAAIDRLIPALQQRGYRFSTVSEALGPVIGPANQPARTSDKWRGGVLVWSVQVADATWRALWLALIVVGVLTVARTLLISLFAVHHARRRRASTWSWGPPVTEPVSIVIPAYNESRTIAAAVRSLAQSEHEGGVEVLLVDDASTDGTSEVVEALGLANVRVVRVPPGGKATALNTGTALSRNNIVVMVDADTVVEPGSVHRLIQPFADPSIGAVAGNVKVGNRRGILGRWQHIEYVIGFNLDRRLYDALGCMPTIPGALGAFRRQALVDAGGLSTETLAEDTDLTMAIHRAGWRVVYEESARAYTEAPATLGQLWKQRYRWSYGTMQAVWKHRRSVLDSGASGRFGRRGLPFIALFTLVLPLLAPVLDLIFLYGTIFLNLWVTAVWWLGMLAIQTLTALLAFRLDREPLGPLWTVPLQQVGYRQVIYLVLLQSGLTALTGRRLGWQKLRRTGEVAAAGAPGG